MQETLVTAFEANRPQLRSFLFRITANRQDAEDILQDTYLKAHEKLATFENRSTLKTWLFAIAANLARDLLRTKKLWPLNAMDLAKEESLKHPDIHLAKFLSVNANSPQGAFEVQEHISFCFTCIGKTLPVDQQTALLLKDVYDHRIEDVAAIMDISEGVAKHLVHDGRKTMTEIFDKKCALVNQHGVCHQCSELNGIFNPRQDFQQKLMKLGLGKSQRKNATDADRLFELRTKLVKAIDPFESSGAELQFCHLEHVSSTIATQA
jgi:RNA polymerase sigma-70 factor (ECF subfamily)